MLPLINEMRTADTRDHSNINLRRIANKHNNAPIQQFE